MIKYKKIITKKISNKKSDNIVFEKKDDKYGKIVNGK